MASNSMNYVALSQSSQYHLKWLDNPSFHSAQTQPTNAPVSSRSPHAKLRTDIESQDGVIDLQRFPNELIYKIAQKMIQPDGRRVWLRYLPAHPPTSNPMQQMYTSQTPRPIALSLDVASKVGSQRNGDYIEISLSDTDARKFSFSPDADMVFVEDHFSDVSRVASDLIDFRKTIQRKHAVEALGRLNSIAIRCNILTATSGGNHDPQRAANWRVLKDFTGLELVFVVWGRRPQPQLKKNAATAGSFQIVRRSDEEDQKLGMQLEDYLARGVVKPKVVVVEYKTR